MHSIKGSNVPKNESKCNQNNVLQSKKLCKLNYPGKDVTNQI